MKKFIDLAIHLYAVISLPIVISFLLGLYVYNVEFFALNYISPIIFYFYLSYLKDSVIFKDFVRAYLITWIAVTGYVVIVSGTILSSFHLVFSPVLSLLLFCYLQTRYKHITTLAIFTVINAFMVAITI